MLERCGLTPPELFIDKLPMNCLAASASGVGIARALMVGSGVILADEPTPMLDVSIRLTLCNLMRGP